MIEIFERNVAIKLMETIKRSMPLLYLDDQFFTGFMASLAGINRIPLNTEIANFRCFDLSSESDFAIKAVIGHHCQQEDQVKIFNAKQFLT